MVSLGYVTMPPFVVLLVSGSRLYDTSVFVLLSLTGLRAGVVALYPAVYGFLDKRVFGRIRLLTRIRRKVAEALHVLHTADKRKWQSILLSVLFAFGRHHILFQPRAGTSSWYDHIVLLRHRPYCRNGSLFPFSFNGHRTREAVLIMFAGAQGTDVLSAEAIAMGFSLWDLPSGFFAWFHLLRR